MDVKKYYVMLVLLLTALAGLVWQKSSSRKMAIIDGLPAVSESGAPVVQASNSKQVDEQQWLVDLVVRDMAEIIGLAAKGKDFDPDSIKVRIEVLNGPGTKFRVQIDGPAGAVTQDLALEQHLWSPANYVKLAQALQAKWSVKPSDNPDPGQDALPARLTAPDSVLLVKESKRISEALSRDPMNAPLHEEAALVLGTLVFREASGQFCDVRPGLSRMAAHLAIAQSNGAPASSSGLLAGALELSLINRQAEALEAIAKLPPGLEAWAMALRLRNTGDWRLLAKPEQATLLEQLAFGHAMTSSLGAGQLMQFMAETKPKAMVDWARLALRDERFSVEEGHVFATDSIRDEFAEFAAVREAFAGKSPAKDELVTLLNEPSARAVVKSDSGGFHMEVLGWGTLASFHQRHICHAIDRTQYFLSEMWGVPDQAAGLEQMVRTKLSGLRLYPLLLLACVCDGDAVAAAGIAAGQFCESHPHLVSTYAWAELVCQSREAGGFGARIPLASKWFTTGLIHGTALEYGVREEPLQCIPAMSNEELDTLKALAPNDFGIALAVAKRKGISTVDEWTKAFGELSRYHLAAARWIAHAAKGDSTQYVIQMENVARLDPNVYCDLGEHLASIRQDDEAARIYLLAFEKATDRVQMSNHCLWLIDYLFDHQRKDEALKVAEEAAEVYSFRGLEAAGHLMERLERWQDARKSYDAIAERYDNVAPLLAYLLRHKASQPALERAYDEIIRAAFPEGLKPAVLADFTGVPKHGAVFTSNSERTRNHGLKVGDVAVSLDGYRVDSMEQYDLVRALTKDAPLRLIIWDGSTYREISAQVPERRFGCGMATYSK